MTIPEPRLVIGDPSMAHYTTRTIDRSEDGMAFLREFFLH